MAKNICRNYSQESLFAGNFNYSQESLFTGKFFPPSFKNKRSVFKLI